MVCSSCGKELRSGARFCNGCGRAVGQKVKKGEVEGSRRTVEVPRAVVTPKPKNAETSKVNYGKESEVSLILPISEELLDHYLDERKQENAGSEEYEERKFPSTEILKKESIEKPFFTRVLVPIGNPQHRQLISIVPVLIIVALLIFVLAYIAAR